LVVEFIIIKHENGTKDYTKKVEIVRQAKNGFTWRIDRAASHKESGPADQDAV
jgi:hypothetical protein